MGFKTIMVSVFLLSLFFHMCALSLLDVGFEGAKFLCIILSFYLNFEKVVFF